MLIHSIILKETLVINKSQLLNLNTVFKVA